MSETLDYCYILCTRKPETSLSLLSGLLDTQKLYIFWHVLLLSGVLMFHLGFALTVPFAFIPPYDVTERSALSLCKVPAWGEQRTTSVRDQWHVRDSVHDVLVQGFSTSDPPINYMWPACTVSNTVSFCMLITVTSYQETLNIHPLMHSGVPNALSFSKYASSASNTC